MREAWQELPHDVLVLNVLVALELLKVGPQVVEQCGVGTRVLEVSV